MKKKYTFFLRNRNNVMKIETNHHYIRELFGFHFSVLTGEKLLRSNHSFHEDLFLRVDLSLRSKLRRETSSLAFIHDENPIFFFSTAIGSWLKMDLLKRRGRCAIIKDDKIGEFILPNLSYLLMSRKMVLVHGAWIKRGRYSFLLIGKSNVGKSTLSRLLKEGNKFKPITDDSTIVQPVGKNVYAYALEPNTHGPISHLFFIQRTKAKKSQIYPINRKEGFKKIVFFSDIILEKSDAHIDFRLETLKKLVSQSRSFILVNGLDLKNNSRKLKKLINSAVKKKQRRNEKNYFLL